MIKQEQIDSWLKEAAERPESATLIIQFIANRLRDLAERNEELLAENIALMTSKRVEEYEKRIAHLQYQLEVLKRQPGIEIPGIEEPAAGQDQPPALRAAPRAASLLLYNPQGELLAVNVPKTQYADGANLATLAGLPQDTGQLRLLGAAPEDELLFLFSSGRIETLPASALAGQPPGPDLSWTQASLPCEPSAGESLVCVAPITRLALADFFVQASRKGFVKKLAVSMGQSILDKRYLGAGTRLPADQAYEVCLCGKDQHLVLVSYEGYLLRVEIKKLAFSVEEALRLDMGDHLAAAFPMRSGASVMAMTQIGKLVQLDDERLEPASAFRTRGQALFSARRREQGVRVAGAGAFAPGDWAASLQVDGLLRLHRAQALFDAGSISAGPGLLAFVPIPSVD